MSPTSSCTPCSGTTAFPREVLLPNSDDSGSEATQFDIIMLENNGEIISDPASLSAEVEGHQTLNIVLPTSLNQM